jgi:hypothetical protein
MIRHWKTYVAGVTFENRPREIATCFVGERLIPTHDRSNKYSRTCVMLDRVDGGNVGSLPDNPDQNVGEEYLEKIANGIHIDVVIVGFLEQSGKYAGKGLVIALVESEASDSPAAVEQYIRNKVEPDQGLHEDGDADLGPTVNRVNAEPNPFAGCLRKIGCWFAIAMVCVVGVIIVSMKSPAPDPLPATPPPTLKPVIAQPAPKPVDPAPVPEAKPVLIAKPVEPVPTPTPTPVPAKPETIQERAKRERQQMIDRKNEKKNPLRSIK